MTISHFHSQGQGHPDVLLHPAPLDRRHLDGLLHPPPRDDLDDHVPPILRRQRHVQGRKVRTGPCALPQLIHARHDGRGQVSGERQWAISIRLQWMNTFTFWCCTRVGGKRF
jgi:hypothetical protein